MPNGELYNIYNDIILQAGKTKNSIRYAYKEEPQFRLISTKMNQNIYRVEFIIKNKHYTQKDIIGFSEEKYKIPVWIEI
jgi:hypothetical protein